MKNALINYRTAIFLAIIILGISLIFIGIGSSKNPEKFIIGNAVSALQKEAPASGISRPAESNVIDVASGNEVQDDVPPVQSIVTSHSSSRVETNKGKIEFEGAVDVSENDLDKYVKIEDNFISVDSEALPSLNKPATLTLYGNYDHTPVVLRDGKFCPECQVLDYSNGRVVFTVPHFSSYSLENCMKTDEQYRVNLSNNYFTLNYPGNYLICDDYNVTDAENRGVIFINSSDVSVDCQGTQITGDYSGTGIILRQFPEYDAWAEKTANFTDLKPILENLGGFLDGITFIENATIKNCNFRNFQYGMNITAIKNS